MNYEITPQVKALLAQYAKYKALNAELSKVAAQLAKQKLRQLPAEGLQSRHDTLANDLQKLSDEMTFDSPATWIQYKYEAYQDEAQPILTMHDLRVHCSKPDYICTKRYTFLNQQLANRRLTTLADGAAYPDEMSLVKLLASTDLQRIAADENFMQNWRSYEYYQKDGAVAKWENYRADA